MLLTSTNVDKKPLKTVFLIAICRPTVDKNAIKISVSNDFLSTLVDSINIFDCRLPGMITPLTCYIKLLPNVLTNQPTGIQHVITLSQIQAVADQTVHELCITL